MFKSQNKCVLTELTSPNDERLRKPVYCIACQSRFKYVVTPSNCRPEWSPKLLSIVIIQHSGAPFLSNPDHEVHKQTLESCYYIHSIIKQFEPVKQHFPECSENEFGVSGCKVQIYF